jgi:2-polyprenyl-3-methyl-5-hydroxy-6-metoxy-1,4-benzoquinol methylase
MSRDVIESGMNTASDTYHTPLYYCPLCGSAAIKPLYRITRYDPPFNVDQCHVCSFIFSNPRFNDEIIKNFYNQDYYAGKAEYSYYDERNAKKFVRHVWEKRIEVIRSHVDGGNLLDVGAAFGGFLECALKYFIPHGIELSSYAAEHALQLLGDRIHNGTLADHPFPRDSFSVITMIEVIEHMHNPAVAVAECYRLLKQRGLLVIQTANMDGLQAKMLKDRYAYFMPGHLSYFSAKNLTQLLHKAGFSKIKIYYPVEFGLLPKLRKSRYAFTSLLDYRSWFRIAIYHMLGKIHYGNFAATSSMVVYAFK